MAGGDDGTLAEGEGAMAFSLSSEFPAAGEDDGAEGEGATAFPRSSMAPANVEPVRKLYERTPPPVRRPAHDQQGAVFCHNTIGAVVGKILNVTDETHACLPCTLGEWIMLAGVIVPNPMTRATK